MADIVGVKIDAAEVRAIERRLVKLGGKPAARAVRSASVFGLKKIKERVKGRMPRRIARAITVKSKAYKSKGLMYSIVGASNDKKFDAVTTDSSGKAHKMRPIKVIHFVESGTKAHRIRGKGLTGRMNINGHWIWGSVQHPGMRGSHITEQAFDTLGNGAIARFQDRAVNRIEHETKKLAQGGKR